MATILRDLRRRGVVVTLTGPQSFNASPATLLTDADVQALRLRGSHVVAALHGAENLRCHGHVPYCDGDPAERPMPVRSPPARAADVGSPAGTLW